MTASLQLDIALPPHTPSIYPCFRATHEKALETWEALASQIGHDGYKIKGAVGVERSLFPSGKKKKKEIRVLVLTSAYFTNSTSDYGQLVARGLCIVQTGPSSKAGMIFRDTW